MVDQMMAEADESGQSEQLPLAWFVDVALLIVADVCVGDGVIDFAEFITLMHKYQESDVDAELRRAFKVFDRDNSGTISRVKLRNSHLYFLYFY